MPERITQIKIAVLGYNVAALFKGTFAIGRPVKAAVSCNHIVRII